MARVQLSILPDGILRSCDGLKIEETGYVVKPCQKFAFPPSSAGLHTARPLYAHLKSSFQLAGHSAMVFRIGLRADNGFSIPSQDVVDKAYVVVAADHPTQVGGK